MVFDDSTAAAIDTLGATPNKTKLVIKADYKIAPNKKVKNSKSADFNSDSITTVIKGYSPFTNYTDTFRVEASHKTGSITPATQQLKRKPLIKRPVINQDSTSRFIFNYDFDYSRASLAQAWRAYINNDSKTIASHKPTNTNKPIAQAEKESCAEITPVNTEESQQNKDQQVTEAPLYSETIESAEGTEIIKDTTAVTFYLQLAASRQPMSGKEVEQIDTTHLTLRKILEDGWYKYQLPLGSDYITARHTIRDYSNKNTFLVAYRGTERLNLWETVKHIQTQKQKKKSSLVFVIQVAASRTPLSYKEQQKLKPGAEHLRQIEEEGWYKYQIVVGPSYPLTIEKWKLCGTHISFPVAYLNGEKIEMAEALKIIR